MSKEEIHAKAVDNADKRIKQVDKNSLSAIADYDRGLIQGFEDGAEWMLDDPTGGALLYAVEKTAERTKKEVIDKAVKWMYNYFVTDRYDMTTTGFGLLESAFKQAMQDESK